jgi:hypothetical protein
LLYLVIQVLFDLAIERVKRIEPCTFTRFYDTFQ